MKNKFLFACLLLAALMLAGCNGWDPNDPNPHCWKIYWMQPTGGEYADYIWCTAEELPEELEGYRPDAEGDNAELKWERTDVTDEDGCDALAEGGGDAPGNYIPDDVVLRCWHIHWPETEGAPEHWHYLWMTEKDLFYVFEEAGVRPVEYNQTSDTDGDACDEKNREE